MEHLQGDARTQERLGRAAELVEERRDVDVVDDGVEAAGLRLGEVEQLVDQGQQVLGARPHERHLLGLLARERLPGGGSVSSRLRPRIELAGVRSSWLMLRRNLLFASLASRSRSFLSSISA